MFSLTVMILASILVAVTVLARLPLHEWWIRACEFPRLQIASVALLTFVLSWWAEDPWRLPALVMSGFVIAVQCYHILPWTPLWPIQVQAADDGNDDRCITLLISNVLTPNRNSSALTEQIHHSQPDLILTLESDNWWQQALDASLTNDWPYTVKIPLDNLYGMHLYSRLPLTETEVKYLIQDDIPSIHTWVTLPCGERIYLHTLHPRPPAPSESEESLWRDAELLLIGQCIHQRDQPTLVFGDLNDVAWSRTTRLFCRVSGMLDPRRGRGMFSTFHAHHRLLRWPLDHVFTSEHFTLKNMSRLKDIGSDHFPILATLCFRPSRASEHEIPEADAEERQAAQETITEAKSRDQET